MLRQHPLIAAINHPAMTLSYSPSDWNNLFALARQHALLPYLASLLLQLPDAEQIPERVRQHLQGALREQQRLRQDLLNELAHLHKALSFCPVLLLKGAAYLSEPSLGLQQRQVGDIDILVPKDQIDAVERTLITHGWSNSHCREYDSLYYRRWMHEIPAMVHVSRGTVVDVHHHLLPLTSAWSFPIEAAWRQRTMKAYQGFGRLNRTWQILHSALHLVLSGETDKLLRDLLDIRHLLCSCDDREALQAEVVTLATEFKLEVPLFAGLTLVQQLFPGTLVSDLPVLSGYRHYSARMLGFLLCKALTPEAPGYILAANILYLLAHLRRMPIRLLIPHLATKLSFRIKKLRG
jgi:hypothetical protein